jgi:hypothetical protein
VMRFQKFLRSPLSKWLNTSGISSRPGAYFMYVVRISTVLYCGKARKGDLGRRWYWVGKHCPKTCQPWEWVFGDIQIPKLFPGWLDSIISADHEFFPMQIPLKHGCFAWWSLVFRLNDYCSRQMFGEIWVAQFTNVRSC